MFLGREGHCSQPETLPYPYPSVSASRGPSGSRALSLTSPPQWKQKVVKTDCRAESFQLKPQHEGLCPAHLRSSAGIPSQGHALVKGGALLLAGTRMLSLPALRKCSLCLWQWAVSSS